jgi:hypothetical protein
MLRYECGPELRAVLIGGLFVDGCRIIRGTFVWRLKRAEQILDNKHVLDTNVYIMCQGPHALVKG